MNKNITKAQQHLAEALKCLPDDFRLQSARSYIRGAINQVDDVVKKRAKRESTQITPEQQWQFQLNQGLINNNQTNALAILEGLNQMINEEKQKLEELKNKRNQSANESDPGDFLNLNG